MVKEKKTLEELKKSVTRKLKDIDSLYDKTDRRSAKKFIFLKLPDSF